ncbi:MAG: phosphomannomutase/phosphoglucomutase [Candidatus Gastranaerophilales bacterium]|nr:phosphomannomutase/phosphoglucomutase [Candidatus Gastranaerophilales bacterium]
MIVDTAFGKNDIRGIYGKDITEELFYYTGRGYIAYISNNHEKLPNNLWVTVCRDARTHSPALSNSLIKGIRSTGANVIDLGLAPTPIGYYSEAAGVPKELTGENSVSGALIVTASHNPGQYNGLKMTFKKQSLNEEQIKIVKKYTLEEYQYRKPVLLEGSLKEYDIIPQYIRELKTAFQNMSQSMDGLIKVVVDSGNGTGGVVAPNLYRQLGCKVVELFSMPDGRFPNHHPNPSEPKNLKDIKKSVIENNADFGIAFDGDSDRIGIVDSRGCQLTGDKLLLIYALDVIEKYKNTKEKPVVVSEVKCSQVLYDTIDNSGGQSVMCKTGHGYIKSMMREKGAILAGEMSGHTFFKDRYYGFDDAVYAGCRIIEIAAKHKRVNPDFKIEDLLKPFDKVCTSQELRLPCPNELKKKVLEGFKQYVKDNPKCFGNPIKDIITLDGMRVVFEGGFALIRQSNTEPVFTLRFEGKSEKECDIYRTAMVEELGDLIDELSKG